MIKRLSFLAALCLIFNVPVLAQQEKGDVELQVSGSLFTFVGDGTSSGSGTLFGKIGLFVTDHLSIGISPLLSVSVSESESFSSNSFEKESKRTWTATTGGGAYFNYTLLSNASTVPYFGAQYYKQDFDTEGTGQAGINGGLKFFVTEKAAFDVSANYLLDLDNSSIGLVVLQFGFSYLW